MNVVFEKLKKFNLYVKLSKYQFCVTSIKFLKYIINKNEIFMNFKKIEAIQSWLIFKNFKKLQIFLNFVNFYCKFVVLYTKMFCFLSNLLRENKNEKQIELFR